MGMGVWMGPITEARVDKDFARHNFPRCLTKPEQWDKNIYERYVKVSSSHQLGMKQ